MSLNQTPRGNRVHIGLFGQTNSGKSSLINALTGQQSALVSPISGTTTDPVYQAMEIHGIGPCVLIDTGGFDDKSELGKLRVDQTKLTLAKTDLAILVLTGQVSALEKEWVEQIKAKQIPIICVLNKIDELDEIGTLKGMIQEVLKMEVLAVSAHTGEGIGVLKEALIRSLPEAFEVVSITGHLVSPEDVVLLVMPQDLQAPKGRLILPQVQTIRDLLDRHCMVMCTTLEQYPKALASLKQPPQMIITDSQVFKAVYEGKPKESLLTSFSVLFAAYKGDLTTFVEGAKAINRLNPQSKVLIAEACTHAPLSEDIGREKIPKLLRKRIGESLTVQVVSGKDFPEDLSAYDLIIHCGACMFNRKHVMSRIEKANSQGVPISNYGVVLAELTGILDQISL